MCVYSSINNTHLEAQSIKNDCFEYTIRLDKEKENTAKKMIILGMRHDFLILSNILCICDFFIPIYLENVIDATMYETMII